MRAASSVWLRRRPLGRGTGAQIKKQPAEKPITAVVTPAIGGIVMGYVIARSLGVRAIFAERVDGKFVLRRGFALAPGEEVIVAEDVITTGGSVREVATLVENSGAHVAGFAALAERGRVGCPVPGAQTCALALAAGDLSAGQLSALCEQGFRLSNREAVRTAGRKTGEEIMITYKKAGVDVDAGDALVDRIKKMSPVIGGFAGLFPLPMKGLKEPQLVGCTDGVGTKLKIAFLADKHDTVGIDLVAMNVNDLHLLRRQAAFLSGLFCLRKTECRCGRKSGQRNRRTAASSPTACLLGGETAEMPGFYKPGEYDLAGFAVGVVDKSKVIDGQNVRPGDIVLGVPSSGLHSNGYSLVRKVFSEAELKRRWKEFLEPTKIYVKAAVAADRTQEAGLESDGAYHRRRIHRQYSARASQRVCRCASPARSWPVPELFHEIQSARGSAGS